MILINIAGTFARAMEKLSMAERTSDIATDSDCNVAKIKRRRHAQKILSEEESSESDGELSINKYLSPLIPIPPQTRHGKRSPSSKTCAIQPDTNAQNDQENIDIFSDANKALPPLPIPPQARYGKRSISNIGSSPKTYTTTDTGAQSDQENIYVSSDANKRSKWDTVSDTNCNSCKGKKY